MATSQLELELKPFIELQIEALIEDNSIKQSRVNKFIDELEERILSIKKLNYDKLLNRTFRLPLIGRPNSLGNDYPKGFKFKPPEGLEVVGGFRTATALMRTNFVDLAVRMPDGCLEHKDIKNQRYHQKRALYLAQLGHLLSGSVGLELIDKIEFRYHQGDFLKPVLLIVPHSSKLKSMTTFQLFAYPHQDSPLKITKLSPNHGNITPRWFFKDYSFEDVLDEKIQEFIQSDSVVAPSPFYNSSILFDLELVPNSDILFEQIGTQPSITNALMLVKIWLYQRELHYHFSFIVSIFVAYLQTKQIIRQNMSSYQIFKIIISSLASADWADSGLSYFDDSIDKITAFKPLFPVIFLSPSGNMNMCYNITIDLYNRLKHEALISQRTLASNTPDTFELLFLKKLTFFNKFDVIVHLPKCTKKMPARLDYLQKFMDHGALTPHIYSENILNLAQRALSDRISLMQQSSQHLMLDKKWNLKSIPYDPSNDENTFTLGLLLDSEKSLRIIDIGPTANTPEAEDFQQFWHPKCQLRLQNGVISETVVWHVESFSQRRAIIKYILTHALKKADVNNVVVHYTFLEKFIKLDNVLFNWATDNLNRASENGGDDKSLKRRHNQSAISAKPIGVGEEVFQKVLHAYNELNKVVRSIEELKYSITSIQPMSNHLRASAVFPPLPVSLQMKESSLKRRKGVTTFPDEFDRMGKILHLEPVEILLTLDSTGKWPNDYEALEATKTEYLIQLGEKLKEKEYSVKFAENYLDVLHGQFIFRLRIKCHKDLTTASAALNKFEIQKRRLDIEVLPRVHAALDQVYREKPAFSLTCRLVKRWISCHLMSDYLSDVAIDLIVAHIFLHPEPYTEPSSSSCGFLRFLMLFSQHDWTKLPLVINFDNQLKIDEISRLKNSMVENREKYQHLVICTPYDKYTSPWTKAQPTSSMYKILRDVCKKAYDYMNNEIMPNLSVVDECKALFRPNFKLFDLVIKLNPQCVQNFFMTIEPPKAYRLFGREPSIKRASAFKVMPIVGLNVVEQFVNILRKEYDEYALFFYDKYGQRVIGVMLKPESEKLLDGEVSRFTDGVKKLGSKLVETITIVKRDQ